MMITLGRNCLSKALSPQIKHIFNNSSKFAVQNGIRRAFYNNSIWMRQPVSKAIKPNFLRGSGTVALNLIAESSTKSNKKVGYWLLSCSGMVFVAVVLGIIIGSYFLLTYSIYEVVEKVVESSKGK